MENSGKMDKKIKYVASQCDEKLEKFNQEIADLKS